MKDRKITKALEKLTVYELNSFRKFLLSPYFNQNEAFVVFFDMLNEAKRTGKDPGQIESRDVWARIYGAESPYNDVKFRKLSSDFFALFEEFITQKELDNDGSEKLRLLMKAYTNRNLSDLFGSLIHHIEYNKKLHQNKNAEHYLNMYNIERAIMDINFHDNTIGRKVEMDKVLNVEEMSYNLDVFFIAEKLRSYCTLLSWNQTFKLNKKIIGIDVILKLAQSPFFKDYPPIAIYYLISVIKSHEGNTEDYYKLKDLLIANLHHFDKKEGKDLLDLVIGYCIGLANKNLPEFGGEALAWYKIGLERDIIIRDEHISPTTFRNIVLYALREGEYEWTEIFIQEYAKFLDPTVRESNVNFSLARVEWYNKNYKRVIQLLAYTDYKEVFQALLSRTLLLLSYYELNETESLESLFSSFKLYLDREKTLTKQRKEQYYSLIKFTRALTKIQSSNKVKLSKLKMEIEKKEAIVNKNWLLDKTDEKLIKA
ncbi:MAG: hypothetical protein IPH36_07485 [Saprospiraceae bacterium]|nr:hypothetical protein [Saprospiraceae bacterium]